MMTHMRTMIGRRQLETDPDTQIQCEDNPCGDTRISLPHTQTWNDAKLVCHNITSQSLLSPDCEVSLAPDNTIRCCPHMERTKCEQDDFLTTLSIVGSCLGKKCCKKRFVFSKYR